MSFAEVNHKFHNRANAAIRNALLAVLLLASLGGIALADDAKMPPCSSPMALALVDRPGTGRTTTTGGSPCVVPAGEVVIEGGVRRQVTTGPNNGIALSSGPLTFARAGVSKHLELGIAPPGPQSRATRGVAAVSAAQGVTDIVIAAKYQLLNFDYAQASLGAGYAPPTGTGGFSAGAPTYSLTANLGLTLSSKLSLAVSNVFGTAVGGDASGLNRPYFIFAPSYTLGYAFDGATTLLAQEALTSRQGPVLPAGNRAFVALQHQLGGRIALDVDYELNLAPELGSRSRAVGFGFVWIAVPGKP